MKESMTRSYRYRGEGEPSTVEAANRYMKAVESWLAEFRGKITAHHFLRCNAARIYVTDKGFRYDRHADLVLSHQASGMHHDKVIERRVVKFSIEWETAG